MLGISVLIITYEWFRPRSNARFVASVDIYDSGDCGGNIIRSVPAGQTAVVLSEGYPKECMYYKIRLKDGLVGYIYAGQMFEILKNGKVVDRVPPKPGWPLLQKAHVSGPVSP